VAVFGVTARTAVGNAGVGSWIERRAADSFISRGQVVHPATWNGFCSATRRSPTQASRPSNDPAKNK